MNFCNRCKNEIEQGEQFCCSCLQEIPNEFECVLCEEDCAHDEFGGFQNDNPEEPICEECLADSKDNDLLEKYYEEEQEKDFFSEEYLDEEI